MRSDLVGQRLRGPSSACLAARGAAAGEGHLASLRAMFGGHVRTVSHTRVGSLLLPWTRSIASPSFETLRVDEHRSSRGARRTAASAGRSSSRRDSAPDRWRPSRSGLALHVAKEQWSRCLLGLGSPALSKRSPMDASGDRTARSIGFDPDVALLDPPTSRRARPGRATPASALAAAPVSLCLCHASSRLAGRGGLLVRPG